MERIQGTCIIICAGDLSVSQLEKQPEDYVIAVDGGYMYCDLLALSPDLVVGDFDSVSKEAALELEALEQKSPAKISRLAREKDDTDTLHAVREGLERGYRKFRIYAGTGGRLEHTIANIQVLLYLKNRGAEGYLMDGEFMGFIIQNEEVVFRKQAEGLLSLFTMGDRAEGVTIKGMKYPLQDYEVKNDFPIGISNEFIGEESSVSVKNGSLFALVRWD